MTEILDGTVVYHPTADPDAIPARPAQVIRPELLADEPAEPADVGRVDLTKRQAGTKESPAADATSDPGDADEAEGAVLVDSAVLAHSEAKVPLRDRPRAPIVPTWLRDREATKDAARWAAGYYGHSVAFHVVRLPQYWWRLASRSPVGLLRIVAGVARWVSDADHRETRSSLVKGGDSYMYLKLREEHRAQTRGRTATVAAGLAAALLLAFMVGLAHPVVQVLALAAGLAALGAVGRKDGVRVTGRATTTHSVPRLTSDLIVSALSTLGIGGLNQALRQAADAVGFPSGVMRDGPGWRAEIDLPSGVTAAQVIEKREKLASGLRRPVGCVWPEPDQDAHAGRLVLWVGDRPMAKSKARTWPLAKPGAKVNLFEPFVVGRDQRGRDVTILLMFVAALIGAIPRMGKTFLLRLILLAASLDVRVELHVFDLKGGGDFKPLRHVAHAFRLGDDDEDIEYIVNDARKLQAEMRRRYKVLRDLPNDVCPESKVTDELASRRDLGLHPIVVAYDECGLAFAHKEHGAELTEICVDLVKRGPAAGIIVIPATQRIDAASVPTGISANAVLRIAMKVTGHQANDMILGTGSYQAGVQTITFSRNDKGIALMVGEGDDPVLLRGDYVDAPEAEIIALRARAARVAAKRLTGYAASDGEDTTEATATLLDHLLAVWPAENPDDPASGPAAKAHSEDLAGRLAAAHPSSYGGWEAIQLAGALTPYGVRTSQVKRGGVNKRGVAHTDVVKANDGRPSSATSSATSSTGGSAGVDLGEEASDVPHTSPDRSRGGGE